MLDQLRLADYQLFYFINHAIANPVLDFLCPVLRNKLSWIPLYALFAFLFYRRYGTGVIYIAIGAGLTVLLTDQISSSLIKPWVHRLRPCNNPMVEARLLLEHCGGGFSFVSSHAANHFGMAVFFAAFFERRKLALRLLLLWAFVVSFSQVYVGVHFPIDVIAGALLGVLLGWIVAYVVVRFAKLQQPGNGT